ncbi:LysR substrate-binding domain-containing protein [Aestuariivirga sp.]|uniref:LysR substrate-binding domain-containing protein n=1 Tax=Aestuariivirga sp. TaxID=2650926 RepID=UPI0025B8BDDB|nr:LysR substrate-binding domain-containing protein [Aestuariivirga sp.]MCA3554867.1 LysR family transcriptional regulator [Aestuariivirga sp.]
MIPNLDIDLLKTFLAISDTGSFTRAAEEVNKTQSAVSMQMKRLEELLSRPLFARDGRASRLTPDGERLVEYARRLVSLNDEAVATFKRPELTGTVRFGTPDDYADRFLPEILARFARTHPLVTVDVECLNTSVLFERTRRGELDLALVTFGCNVQTDEPVRREPLVWVTSARHSTHLLDVMPLAITHAGCEWRSTVIEALDRIGRKYRVAYSSSNSNALNAAVQSGLAVGAVPELCVRPDMRVLTGKDGFPPLGSFEIGLMRKPGRGSSAVEALARHVAESLGNFSVGMMAAE